MSAGTHIEWTDATWNPVVGCTRVSSGCDHCYAVRASHRLAGMGQANYKGLTVLNGKGERHFNGTVRCLPERLDDPLYWRKPRRVFVNSMSDLFHKDVPFKFVETVFGVMAVCPEHTFQILTKRPQRAAQFLEDRGDVIDAARQCVLASDSRRLGFLECEACLPLGNVWLGTSCEDQATLDERVPHLLNCPAAVRFLSLEPLLGSIDLRFGIVKDGDHVHVATPQEMGIHWVIVGGESGPGARPMHPDGVRSIRDQCVAAGVPFFFKQWGEWRPWDDDDVADQKTQRVQSRTVVVMDERMIRLGKKATGAVLDGREWREYPMGTGQRI